MTAYERTLLGRAAAHVHDDLTVDGARGLAAREGIDFATAVLYDRVRRSQVHGDFIRRLESPEMPAGQLDATVVIVPGAFYKEFPHTGADGRLLREEAAQFGCRSELIPLPSFGPLAESASLITAWLDARPDEPVILVSLSKGGADVKTALAQPGGPRAFRNVVAWINLCGLLEGTPLAGWVLGNRLRSCWFRLLFWFRGYPFAAIRDLVRAPGGPLDFDLVVPPHVRLISVVGFPLRCHLTNRLARRCHRRVAPLGPNDGAGIVLADVFRWPGLVYPVWGADHYMRPAGADVRLIARRILGWLAATRSAAQGSAPETPRAPLRCAPGRG
jgi:hypothetical protein